MPVRAASEAVGYTCRYRLLVKASVFRPGLSHSINSTDTMKLFIMTILQIYVHADINKERRTDYIMSERKRYCVIFVAVAMRATQRNGLGYSMLFV
jgi:hypothetical protein